MSKKSVSSFADLAKQFGLETPKEKESSSSYTLIPDKSSKPNTGGRKSNNYSRGGYNNRNNGFNKNKGGFNSNNSDAPSAPYNFVPLNNIVIKPDLANFIAKAKDIQSGYKAFIKSGKKYSGYFDVQIENITPYYIAGSEGFFSDGENVCIPGSSLRGCIKNLFKIVTDSGVNTTDDPDLTDKHLYYRAMASGYKPLRESYNDRMVDQVKKDDGTMSGKSKAEAGFIVKKDKQYFICPGEYTVEKSKAGWRKAVEIANPPKPYVKWNDKNEARIFTGSMHGSQFKRESELPKNFAKEPILGHGTDKYGNKTIKVDTSKVHYYKIFNPRWSTMLPIPQNIVRDYIDDKNRKGLNLLDEKNNLHNGNAYRNERFSYVIPCFYTANGDTVSHFGAGPYYRIPYKNSIGDHIPAAIKDPQIDFTSAVFGNKEHWASRVQFEDCFLADGQTAKFYEKDYVKILMGPNPTSFQFYLNTNGNTPLHWDEKTNIRGHKFYWHRKLNWRETNPKMCKDSINKQIEPLKENHKFSGRIRFKNLDATELGALSYVLNICQNKDTCFKLGMGKPVGMGSVKVTAQLKLQNDSYFQTLFDGNDFAAAKSTDMQTFITEFNSYIDQHLAKNAQAKNNYQRRINALLTILSTKYMDNDDWNNEKTRYYDVNNRADKKILNSRIPLPSIEEVVKQIK